MWAFEATDIGRVGRAEISMAPLVLLVGKNNIGKSYIATVAWALTNAQSLMWRDDARSRRPKWCETFIAQVDRKEPAQIQVTDQLANELIDYFNSELSRNGHELLAEVFAYDGFDRTTVRVKADQPFSPFTVSANLVEPLEPERQRPYVRLVLSENEGRRPAHLRIPVLPGGPRFGDRFIVELLYRVLLGAHENRRQTLYIPAARTGLMLSLRVMITQLFERDPAPTARLPLPLIDFLQRLTLPPPPVARSQQSQIATWLQNVIMHGVIEASTDEIPSFTYVPDNTTVSLPLHAASSMITELAPFLLLLKQTSAVRQIIFEEPEAHLHLAAQRSMARALARLVNLGVGVLVTSHSDTFIQQINNLMHLHNHPQKSDLMKQLGYEDADLINPSDARAYEFSERGDKTDVTEVRKETAGFVVPSLNDTLVNLANETIKLQDSEE